MLNHESKPAVGLDQLGGAAAWFAAGPGDDGWLAAGAVGWLGLVAACCEVASPVGSAIGPTDADCAGSVVTGRTAVFTTAGSSRSLR